MNILYRAALLIVVLGITPPVNSQELKKDGILQYQGGRIAAALAFAPAERIVVAHVASGSAGENLNKVNWSEVRLLDVATGKLRVLARAATPFALPGIGANHTIRGFTVDGKTLVVSTSDPGGTITELRLEVAEPRAEAARTKVNPQRLKGMKAAVADIEGGLLRMRQIPPPAPPWYSEYLELLKKECGLELINVDTSNDKVLAEMHAYNDVMLLEIEHRHGKGILNKLGERVRKEYEAKRK